MKMREYIILVNGPLVDNERHPPTPGILNESVLNIESLAY